MESISKDDFIKMMQRDLSKRKKIQIQAAIDLNGYAFTQSTKIKKGIGRHKINKQNLK